MLPDPLHPAVVHFPIVLVVLLPIVAAVALVLIRRGGDARRLWLPVLSLSVALTAASWAAVQTGQEEEDIVERVVGDDPIHEHEEAAELFLILTVAMTALTAGGLAKGAVGRMARPVAMVGALALVIAGVQVGGSGGELVYEYGAGEAYASADAPSDSRRDGRDDRHREDRDDRDDH